MGLCVGSARGVTSKVYVRYSLQLRLEARRSGNRGFHTSPTRDHQKPEISEQHLQGLGLRRHTETRISIQFELMTSTLLIKGNAFGGSLSMLLESAVALILVFRCRCSAKEHARLLQRRNGKTQLDHLRSRPHTKCTVHCLLDVYYLYHKLHYTESCMLAPLIYLSCFNRFASPAFGS